MDIKIPQFQESGDFYVKYYEEYKPMNEKMSEYYKIRGKLIYSGIIISIFGGIYYLYDK